MGCVGLEFHVITTTPTLTLLRQFCRPTALALSLSLSHSHSPSHPPPTLTHSLTHTRHCTPEQSHATSSWYAMGIQVIITSRCAQNGLSVEEKRIKSIRRQVEQERKMKMNSMKTAKWPHLTPHPPVKTSPPSVEARDAHVVWS